MSEGKVLQISAEDAKYLDPSQIASIQMIDGTTIIVQGNEVDEGFVEEAQPEEQQNQNQTQEVQQGEQPKLRGRGGVLGALAGVAAGTALLGTAAAIGGAMRRPYRMGPPVMMRPPPPPMFGPPRPYMMRGPMYY